MKFYWNWIRHARISGHDGDPKMCDPFKMGGRQRPRETAPGVPASQHSRCRANVAHTRQSRPDYGPGLKAKALKTFQVLPSSLGSGPKGKQHQPTAEPFERLASSRNWTTQQIRSESLRGLCGPGVLTTQGAHHLAGGQHSKSLVLNPNPAQQTSIFPLLRIAPDGSHGPPMLRPLGAGAKPVTG